MKKSIERFYPLIVFLLAFLLYANTMINDYNLDDELVTINHRTTSKGFSGISEIFTSFYYEDDKGYKYDYRPITHVSFAIEHQFFGDNPHVSHAINVILYALLCLLIFYLANSLAPDRSPLLGFFVATIFAIHPIHTEVVASIKNRDEILSLIFGVLAFLSIFKLNPKEGFFKNLIAWGIALIFFLLGFFSKNSIIVIIALLPFSIILFRKETKLWFPLLFYAVGLFLIKDYLFLSSGTLIIYFLLGCFILIGAQFFPKFEYKPLIQRLKQAVKVGVVYANSSLKKDSLIPSIIFYVLLNVTGLILKDASLVTWAYLFFLVLNVERIKQQFYHFSVILVLSLLAVFVVSVDGGLLIGYVLFYLSIRFFKPFLLLSLLPFSDIGAYANLPGFAYPIWFFTLVPMALGGYLNFNFFKRLVNQRNRFVLVIFVSLFVSIGLREFKKETITEFQAVEEVAQFDQKDDRPVLFIENPIIENWDYEHRFALALNANSFYIGKLLFPYPLSYYYGYDQFKIYNFKDWHTILSIVTLLLIFLGSLYFLAKGRLLTFFSILWIELSILPYSNLLTPVAGIVGERLAFAASLGFSILIGIGFYKLWKSHRFRVPLGIVCIVLVLMCSCFVVYRNTLWKNKVTLFEHDIHQVNNSAQAHALFGSAIMASLKSSQNGYTDEDEINRATTHFEKALKIYPDFLNWWFDLGRVYFVKKDYLKAKEAFKRASEIDSTYSSTYGYLLDIANMEGNAADVIVYSNLFLVNNPNNIDVLLNLSSVLYFSEKFEEAILVNNRIIEIDNSIPEAYLNKAYSFIKLGDITIAKSYLAKGKLLSPNHADVLSLEKLLSGN
jgi:tetratricopeptide (TPR) repeat protein